MTPRPSPLEILLTDYAHACPHPPYALTTLHDAHIAQDHWTDKLALTPHEGTQIIPVLRLLELMPEDLPERWDLAMETAFSALPGALIWRAARLLVLLPAALPVRRRDRLERALAQRMIDSILDENHASDLDAGILIELMPQVGELMVEIALARTPDPSRTKPQTAKILQLLGMLAEDAPEGLDPLLGEVFELWDAQEGLAEDEEVLFYLQRLDLERIEDLILNAPRFPWWAARSWPTPLIIMEAVQLAGALSLAELPLADAMTRTLAEAGEVAVPIIEAELKSPSEGATMQGRVALINALGQLGSATSGPVLLAALPEQSQTLRSAAQEALAALGPGSALASIEQALGDGRPHVRLAAAQVLGGWTGHPTVEDLVRRMRATETHGSVMAALNAAVVSEPSGEHPWGQADNLLNSVRIVSSEVGSWYNMSGWRTRLNEGMDFLAYVYQWLARAQLWSYHRPRRMWFDVLKHNRGEPLAPWVAVRGLELTLEMTQSDYVAAISDVFGAWLRGPSVHAIREGHASRLALYSDLIETQQDSGPTELHLEVMHDSSERMRLLAVGALSKQGAAVVPSLLPLLTASKAAIREAAASCLGLIGDESALAALTEALGVERAAKAKGAIQKARDACDPLMRGFAGGGRSAGDLYDLREPMEANEGLALLRALAYETPSARVWVRMCNALERLRGTGAEPLGLAYLLDHGVADWSIELKPRPAHWPKNSALDALRPYGGGEAWVGAVWLPVQALMGSEGPGRLKAAIKPLEKGTRARRLKGEDLPDFLAMVQRVWQWCQDNDMPAGAVEVRCDGGCGYSDNSPTSMMRLWHGVGVRFDRKRGGDTRHPHGVRLVRVKVPKGHALGLQHALDSQRRLDLLPLLPPMEAP